MGEYSGFEEAVSSAVRECETYEPRPDRAAAYDERFALYSEIYDRLADLNHRL